MKKIPLFYQSNDDFENIHSNLKLFQCKYCLMIGTLILHGYLKGYDEQNHSPDFKRGHRIFCSNRNNKKGCGKTFSIIKSGLLKFCTTSANTIWNFLDNLMKGLSKKEAFNKTNIDISLTSIYRYSKKILFKQHCIRTLLMQIKPPPSESQLKNSILLTIQHLKDAFNMNNCPVTAFQEHFQVSFI